MQVKQPLYPSRAQFVGQKEGVGSEKSLTVLSEGGVGMRIPE